MINKDGDHLKINYSNSYRSHDLYYGRSVYKNLSFKQFFKRNHLELYLVRTRTSILPALKFNVFRSNRLDHFIGCEHFLLMQIPSWHSALIFSKNQIDSFYNKNCKYSLGSYINAHLIDEIYE